MCPVSSPDVAHFYFVVAVGLSAALGIAVVAGLPDARQAPGQRIIAGPAAQQFADVVPLLGEQAGEQPPLGRQAQPGTVSAEGLGHAGDQADLARAVLVGPAGANVAPRAGLAR